MKLCILYMCVRLTIFLYMLIDKISLHAELNILVSDIKFYNYLFFKYIVLEY